MFFDHSKDKDGIGVGILPITHEKEMIPYYLRSEFISTHNIAKYEALKHGLRILLSFNIENVHAYVDSLLIVNQVNEKWKVKDAKLTSH
uniref:RNase H type-1 domain-containing protein n=1 Tax=Nymphaea colorata TaxID=210225 RepID=A0A5K0ZDM1_9MAGN